MARLFMMIRLPRRRTALIVRVTHNVPAKACRSIRFTVALAVSRWRLVPLLTDDIRTNCDTRLAAYPL